MRGTWPVELLTCTAQQFRLTCMQLTCRHLEADSRMALRPGSLLAVHRNLRQHMHIDAASVAALEIIDPTPQAGAQKRDSSLYRWNSSLCALFSILPVMLQLNPVLMHACKTVIQQQHPHPCRLLYHTKTRCGARLLRVRDAADCCMQHFSRIVQLMPTKLQAAVYRTSSHVLLYVHAGQPAAAAGGPGDTGDAAGCCGGAAGRGDPAVRCAGEMTGIITCCSVLACIPESELRTAAWLRVLIKESAAGVPLADIELRFGGLGLLLSE